MAIRTVLTERNLAQEEIPDLIDTIARGHREWIDDVADRLRHLLPAVQQEAVGEDTPRERDPRGHQESGPVHGVEADDILPDDMQIRRPEAPERVLLIRKA